MGEYPTLVELFQQTVATHPDRPALTGPGSPATTWREYGTQVATLASGLIALGVRPGDTVALLTRNTPAFHVADTAVMHAGGIPFSLHAVDPAPVLTGLAGVAHARLVMAEPEFLGSGRQVVAGLGEGARLILLTDQPVEGELTLADVRTAGRQPADDVWRAITDEDTATLIFTSGTTGRPKAVKLSHRSITVSLRSFQKLAPVQPDGRLISYLPLNHIAERFMTYYAAMAFGAEITCVPDADQLYAEIERLRPTRFFGVPRVYEKVADRAREIIGSDPELTAALAVTLPSVRRTQAASRPEPSPENETAAVRDAYSKLAVVGERLGLGSATYRGVATAPSAYGLLEFFLAAGLPVGDIWGLSEAIMCTSNPPDGIRLGTVGRFLDDVEGVIAQDGELYVRGPNVFSGYLHDEAKTREVLGEDGWIHTGDLGEIQDGYLRIIGRKKEIMITSTGKNLVPAVIEGAIKQESPLIDQVLAVADGRRYVTALIALDGLELRRFAEKYDLAGTFEELAHSTPVLAEVERAVGRGNRSLSKTETVRRWQIAPAEWNPGGDEVTPTMKLRRREIIQKYATEIDGLYR